MRNYILRIARELNVPMHGPRSRTAPHRSPPSLTPLAARLCLDTYGTKENDN
jgi:hypothetical protein